MGFAEWGIVAASALIHVSYFVTLLRGYRAADLTVVYPVARGTAPLLAALCVLAVIAGVFLIAGGPGLCRAARDPASQRRVRLGIGWGAATGVQIACDTLVDGFAVKVLLLSPILVDYFGNLLRLPVLAPLLWRERQTLPALWRTRWRAALTVAVLGPAGYVLALFAMQRAPASAVAPAREMSMLFAALLGGTLLRETDMAARLVGVVFIAIGVAALMRGAS